MMKRVFLHLFVIVLLLGTAVPLLAQEDTQPNGRVTGQIVNMTPEGVVPNSLPLMLHAWDKDFNEKLMVEGHSSTAGSFQFDEVALNPDWLYAVMLTVDDVLYFSEPTPIVDGAATLDLEVPIYDKTNDTVAVRVERQHVFFDAAQGGLLVGEIYILSNLGDRTVAGSSGEDALLAPLQFALPEVAASVTFEGDDNGRYLRTPSGLVDTAPLRPGERTGQVVVRYVLPYEDGMTYSLNPNWLTNGVNFLVPDGIGISLAGEGLVEEGGRDMGDGRQMTMYSFGSIQPEQPLSLTLSGELALIPVSPEVEISETLSPGSISKELAVGGAFLGLLLVGVGVWWHLRTDQAAAEQELAETEASFDDLVLQLAQLEADHDQGDLDETIYLQQRYRLRQQAQIVLARAEAG